MGPERRGSVNSVCPRRAAASESRYLLVVSTGRSGNGERVLMVAHSCWLKPSLPESADWLRAAVATMRNDPSNTASNTPNHSADLRITSSLPCGFQCTKYITEHSTRRRVITAGVCLG